MPLTMLVCFNTQEMKETKPLDYVLWVFCALNLLEMALELSYFKYYLDKGINLEQRIKLPEMLRFKDYLRYVFLSLCCGSITLTLGLTLYSVQPCLYNEYTKENGKECVECSFVLTDACLTCVGPAECTQCQDGFYLDDKQCSLCDDNWRNCAQCDNKQCLSCVQGFYLNRFQCNSCVEVDGCMPGMCGAFGCTQCMRGYYRRGTQCVKCSALMPGCTECSSS